jgi:hypothetical protein
MKLKLHNIFHCPQGRWSGVCEAIGEPNKRMNKPCSPQVNFRFRVETDEGEKLVRRTFCADFTYGSELYLFMASWLDDDLERLLDDDGEIDLDVLIGREADLYITHGLQAAQYEYPVVNIAGIYPPGRMSED